MDVGLSSDVWIHVSVVRQLEANEVKRAGELRDIITSLGPFFIKLGQALSIRPDILSPKAMVELQKLCDKVGTDGPVLINATWVYWCAQDGLVDQLAFLASGSASSVLDLVADSSLPRFLVGAVL
jgi:hypothetical protein